MLEKPYYEMIRDIENDIETKRLAEIEIEESVLSSLARYYNTEST